MRYKSIRELDFRNRIYALRDSAPGFVQLHDGKHESGFAGFWQDIRLESVHYCGETAVVDLGATWIGGSSMSTSHVRVYELLSPPDLDYKILLQSEIDFGYVSEMPIEVDCESMRVTIYSADRWMVRENRMLRGCLNLKTMEVEAVQEMPIKAELDSRGPDDH